MESKGKVAVVTGSGVGVGRTTAIRLAEMGCSVIVNYCRSAAEAAETVEECKSKGSHAIGVQADVTNDTDCRRLIHAAEEHYGRLDILVNNAGTTTFVNFADLEGLTDEIWDQTYRTNVLGAFYCVRAAVPLMNKSGGAIVNVASIAGILGLGSSIAYAASKAALLNMTRALAKTLGPSIRVNAVAPGAIDTRWLRQGLGEKGYHALRDSLRTTTPLQEITTTEDVADAIIWLATGARNTTGETIIVDGGYHLGMGHGFVARRPE